MKKYFITILSVLIFFSFIDISAQTAAEICAASKISYMKKSKKINQVQYPGDQNIDVTYYKLDIKVDYNKSSNPVVALFGDVTIKAKSTADGLTSAFFDLNSASLSVTNVKVNGTDQTINHTNNKLTVNFDRPLNAGEEFTVEVVYNGDPTSSGFGSFGYDTNQDAIWTLSEPYGASDWWVCKDTPADKADSADIWITTADNLIPTSNGTLRNIVDNNDATHTYKWHEQYPIAQYLISMTIAPYDIYTNYFKYSSTDSMEVTNYLYPYSNTVSNKNILSETPNMLKVYSDLFGLYPFINEKYGHAEFGWGGGMEHQTLTSIGPYAIRRDIVAHELAHQWFGDMITCADWQNIWLNEGFASYCEALYFEKADGFSAYQNHMEDFLFQGQMAMGSIYVQNINSVNSIFDQYRSYAKGADVLHMLRHVVGDNNFFQIMYDYANDPKLKYGAAVTEDFQRVAEEVSNMDLSWFFKEWIYGIDYPRYTFGWSTTASGNMFDTYLQITQDQDSTIFKMPIDLKVTYTDNTEETIVVWDSLKNQEFNLSLSKEPKNIILDPNDWILKYVKTTSVEETNDLQKDFVLYGIYPNPFNPSTKIEFSVNKQQPISIYVFNSLGQKVDVIAENKIYPKGRYIENWTPKKLASGIYLVKINTDNYHQTKKVVLLK